MNICLKRSIGFALAAGVVIPATVSATNGYISHGWGTKSKAMAGVATALPQDTLVTATNPAGMAFLGTRLDLGLSFFNPSDRGYKANPDFTPPSCPTCLPPAGFVTPGTYTSSGDWFLIPSFGYNHEIDDRSTIGIAVYGNGGMNTEYTQRPVWENFAAPPNALIGPVPGQPPGTLGIIGFDNPPPVAPNNANPGGFLTATTPTGINLEQLFIEIPYTFKFADGKQSVGVAPVLAVQSLEVQGLEPFQSASFSPTKVTNNGEDWSYGFGLHLGWFGAVTDQLDLGISYRTKMRMSDFDDYEGLLAEGGNFDIPAMLNLGLAYRPTQSLTLGLDYQRIFYGDVDSISNTNDVDLQSQCIQRTATGQPLESVCLGGSSGAGFGWDSLDVLKLGLRWDYNDEWSFMGGVSWSSDFIENKQALFNVLAPATVKYHFTLGASYRLSPSDEISLSLAYMPEEEIEGTSPSITGTQTGSLFMEQKEIEIQWSHRF